MKSNDTRIDDSRAANATGAPNQQTQLRRADLGQSRIPDHTRHAEKRFESKRPLYAGLSLSRIAVIFCK